MNQQMSKSLRRRSTRLSIGGFSEIHEVNEAQTDVSSELENGPGHLGSIWLDCVPTPKPYKKRRRDSIFVPNQRYPLIDTTEIINNVHNNIDLNAVSFLQSKNSLSPKQTYDSFEISRTSVSPNMDVSSSMLSTDSELDENTSLESSVSSISPSKENCYPHKGIHAQIYSDSCNPLGFANDQNCDTSHMPPDDNINIDQSHMEIPGKEKSEMDFAEENLRLHHQQTANMSRSNDEVYYDGSVEDNSSTNISVFMEINSDSFSDNHPPSETISLPILSDDHLSSDTNYNNNFNRTSNSVGDVCTESIVSSSYGSTSAPSITGMPVLYRASSIDTDCTIGDFPLATDPPSLSATSQNSVLVTTASSDVLNCSLKLSQPVKVSCSPTVIRSGSILCANAILNTSSEVLFTFPEFSHSRFPYASLSPTEQTVSRTNVHTLETDSKLSDEIAYHDQDACTNLNTQSVLDRTMHIIHEQFNNQIDSVVKLEGSSVTVNKSIQNSIDQHKPNFDNRLTNISEIEEIDVEPLNNVNSEISFSSNPAPSTLCMTKKNRRNRNQTRNNEIELYSNHSDRKLRNRSNAKPSHRDVNKAHTSIHTKIESELETLSNIQELYIKRNYVPPKPKSFETIPEIGYVRNKTKYRRYIKFDDSRRASAKLIQRKRKASQLQWYSKKLTVTDMDVDKKLRLLEELSD